MSSQDYAEMIEIPVSGCEIVTEPKQSRKRNKKRFIKKFGYGGYEKEANLTDEKSVCIRQAGDEDVIYRPEVEEDDYTPYDDLSSKKEKRAKKNFKWDLVSAQVVAIFVLAVGLILTNVFLKDSGINNLFRSVFSESNEAKDERTYDAFQAFSPSRTQVTVDGGIITLNTSGAVYSPAEGKVEKVTENDKKYTIIVEHSDLFKTVITDLDYCYYKEGDSVFTSTPVGYTLSGGSQVAMYNGESLITAFSVEDGSVVWQS